MKILFFINSLASGGAERVTASLANFWAEKHWSVTIVTMASKEFDFYKLHPTIHRVSLDLTDPSYHYFSAVSNNSKRIRALLKILRRERPDVAIAMMPTANVILAIAGKLAGIPVIGSERVYPPAVRLGPFWECARRIIYPYLDGMVAQTYDSKKWLTDKACSKRIAVIPNPVNHPLAYNTPVVPVERVLNALRGDMLLLAVGRLVEQKGFDRLLNAFAETAKRHRNWSLVILGEGSLRGALTEQANRLGLDGRVAFPGLTGNVGDWFAKADAYVMTSHFEGFPNTLLEAMSYGLPSIAIDCKTGPSDLITSEVDGILVSNDDPYELFFALDRLMSNPDLRVYLAQNAKQARDKFAIEQIASCWEVELKSVAMPRS